MISSSHHRTVTSLDQLFHILFDLLQRQQQEQSTLTNGITTSTHNNDSSEIIISSCNANLSSSSSLQPSPIPHAPVAGQQPKRILSFGKKVVDVGLSAIQSENVNKNNNNNFEKDVNSSSSTANNSNNYNDAVVVSSIVGSCTGSVNSEIYNQQARNSSSAIQPYNGNNSQQPQSIAQAKTATVKNGNNSPLQEIQYLLNAFLGALKRKHAQFNAMIEKKKSLMLMMGGRNEDIAAKNSILEEEDFYISRHDEISAAQGKPSNFCNSSKSSTSSNEEQRNSAMFLRFQLLENEVLGITSENDEKIRIAKKETKIGDEDVQTPQKNFRHLVSSCLQFRQTTTTLIQFLILELPLPNNNNNNNKRTEAKNNNELIDDGDVPSFQQILLRLTWNEMIARTMKKQNDGRDKFGETSRRRQREVDDQCEQSAGQQAAATSISANETTISWCQFFNSLFVDGFLAIAESQTKREKNVDDEEETKWIHQNYITSNDRRKFLEKLLSPTNLSNNKNNNSKTNSSVPDLQQQQVARILAQYLFHVGGTCQSCAHREETQDSTSSAESSSVLSTILGFLSSHHRSAILSAFSNLVRDNLSNNDATNASVIPTIFSSSFLQILRSQAKVESAGSSSSSSVSSGEFFNESSLLQFFAAETRAENSHHHLHHHSHSKIVSTLIQAHREKVRLVAANSIFKSIQNEIIEDPLQFFGSCASSSSSPVQISCRQLSVFNVESGRNAYQSVSGSLDFASSLLRWLVDVAKNEMPQIMKGKKTSQDGGGNRDDKILQDGDEDDDTSSMLLLILPLICLYVPVTPLSDEENFLRQCARLSSSSSSSVSKKNSSQSNNNNNNNNSSTNISNQMSLLVEESDKLLEMVENDSNHDDAFYFPEKHKLQKQQQANKNSKTLFPKTNDDLTNLYLFSLALGLELFLELQHRSFTNNNTNNNNIFSPKSSSQTVTRNQQKEDIVIRFILRLRTIFHFQTSVTPVMTSSSSSSATASSTTTGFSSLINDMDDSLPMNSSLSSSSSLLQNSAAATVNTANPTSCLDFIHVLNSSLMLEYHQHHHTSLATPTNNINNNNNNNNLNDYPSLNNNTNGNNNSSNFSTWWDILLISLSAESLITHAILSEQGISGLNSEDTSSSPFLESFEGRHFLQEFFGKFCKTFLDLNLRFSQNNNSNNNNMKNYRSGSGLSLGLSSNTVFCSNNHHRFHSSFGSSSSSSSPSFSRSFSADHNNTSNATATSKHKHDDVDEDGGVSVLEQEQQDAEIEELDAKLNFYASLLEDQEQIIFGLSKILKWSRGAILSLGRGCSTMNRGTSDFNQDRSFYEQATGEKQESIISHLENCVLQQYGLFVRKLAPARNNNNNNKTKFLLLAFLLKEILCPNVNNKNSLQKSFDNQQQQQNLQLRTSVRTTINSLFGNSADRLGKFIIKVASMFEEKNGNGHEHNAADEAFNFVQNVCKYLAPKLSSEIVAELREKVNMPF